MKIKYFYAILLLTISIVAKSQDIKSRLKNQAQEMSEASINGNYNLLLKYTYPKFVEQFGGEEELLKVIVEAMENLKVEGTKIESVEIGETGNYFKAGNELHCLLAEKIILSTKNGRFLINGFLLAITTDNGQNWFFIDCNIGKDVILSFFPNFNNELIIPEKNKPIKI
jgi:hypothetical protein